MPKRKPASPPATPHEEDFEIESGEETEEEKTAKEVSEFRFSLEPAVIQKSTCTLYRQYPRVRARGKKTSLDHYALQDFSWDQVENVHGGGKYKLWIDIGDKKEHTFYWYSPKPAIIQQADFFLLDDQGHVIMTNTQQQPANPTPETAPATKSDFASLADVIRASKSDPDTQKQAMEASIGMMASTFQRTLEVVASTNKPQEESKELAEIRRELAELKNTQHKAEIARLEARIDQLTQNQNQPATHGEAATLTEAADALGIEGGAVGLIRSMVSKTGKEETGWGYVGKTIADAFGHVLRNSGPALVNWLQNWNRIREMEILARQPQQPGQPIRQAVQYVPTPTAMPAASPLPTEIPPPMPPGQQPATEPTETESAQAMQALAFLAAEVPKTIRHYFDLGFSGEAVADIVKFNFKPWLPMLRSLFPTVDELLSMAKEDPNMKELLAPEYWQKWQEKNDTEYADFRAWAGDFFEKMHELDPDELPPGQPLPNLTPKGIQ